MINDSDDRAVLLVMLAAILSAAFILFVNITGNSFGGICAKSHKPDTPSYKECINNLVNKGTKK